MMFKIGDKVVNTAGFKGELGTVVSIEFAPDFYMVVYDSDTGKYRWPTEPGNIELLETPAQKLIKEWMS